MAGVAALKAGQLQHHRSGVFPQHIQAHGDEEQAIIRGAKLGLANIHVHSTKKMRALRGLSLRTMRKLSPEDADGKLASRQRDCGDDGKAAERSSQACILAKRRIDSLFKMWRLCSFLDSLYVLWMVPYRLGFLFDPWSTAEAASEWSVELSVLTAVDVAGCLLRSWVFRLKLRQAARRFGVLLLLLLVRLTCSKWTVVTRLHAALNAQSKPRSRSSARMSVAQSQGMVQPDVYNLFQREGTLLRRNGSVKSAARSRASVREGISQRESELRAPLSRFAIIGLIGNCVPWEAIILGSGRNYGYLHVVGVVRFVQAYGNARTQFSSVVMPIFSRWRSMQALSFSTVSITTYLFVLGIYLSHLAACGYMLVAHAECGRSFAHCSKEPFPEAWVLRDNLERASQLRKYTRSLYWACKTVVTLGQGDLIPVTLVETAYRVCVQFVSGLWATAIVTAYSFYFTNKDANMATNISTQLIQARKFLRAREVSPELATAVCAYFYYMERTRNGVEEALILSNLPPHYRSQCSNYVKFKCFSQIPIFRNRQGAFLRTILGLLEGDFFMPDQTVLAVGDKEEMLILANGSIRIVDVRGGGVLVGRLTAGTSYAEYALFEDHSAQNHLIADSFCELWQLSRRSFELAAQKHFSSADSNNAAQNKQATASNALPLRSLNSLSSMEASARMVKLAGKGSTLMKAFARKGSSALLHKHDMPVVVTWRYPSSRFRRAWVRVECVLLLFLLWEVPYQVAFQRGFGLLNNYSDHPNAGAIPVTFQRVAFFGSLLVELFFLSDMVLRVFFFVQSVTTDAAKLELAKNDNTPAAADVTTPITAARPRVPVPSGRARLFRLLEEIRGAFQRYRESEPDCWLDLIANLPVPLVWDVLPKEHFSNRTGLVVRFVRLARLLRARHLRRKLKAIMVELGFTPAQRMLVYIVTLCVTVGNLAGCLFFLANDDADFHGGLPADGVAFSSISWQSCLEAASLADNCTWYMFDRSAFDIDAPYLRSLHWSIVLLSTVGYGDIVAFSTIECAVGCVWIFLGANICYFTSSALSSVLDQFSIVGLLKDERAEELNVALAGMPTVSEATKHAVRSFFEMKWKFNGSTMTSGELAHRLPLSLRRKLYGSLYLDDFLRCTLFADCAEQDEFVRQLALVTTSEIFLKQIVVAREGHLATEFFLIQSGECECLLPAMRMPSADRSASMGHSDSVALRWLNLSTASATSPFKVAATAAATTSSTLWASRKKHKKNESTMAKSAPQLGEQAGPSTRKLSWTTRKAARATFAAPGSVIPDHVHMLRLQKKKSSLFKSVANIVHDRSDHKVGGNTVDEPGDTEAKRKTAAAAQMEKLQMRQLQQQPRLSPHWSAATASPSPADDRVHPAALSPKRLIVKGEATPASPPVTAPPLSSPPLRGKPYLHRRDTLRSVAAPATWAAPATPVPVLMLKPSDYFGEESLLSAPELYDVTVRVVSSAAQVAVVSRADYLAVAARFPDQAAKVKARNQTQRVLDRQVLQTHRANFVSKPKIAKFFFDAQGGAPGSDGEDGNMSIGTGAGHSSGLARFVLDPEARFALWWHRAVRLVLVYNFYAISYRIAFLAHPKPRTMLVLTVVDYLTDVVFLVDLFLKYGHMGYVELGEKVMDPAEIRRKYRESWLWADCASMLPLYFVTGSDWVKTLTRAPRLVRSVHLAGITHDTQTYIQQHYLKGNTLFASLFDLAKFFLIFMSTAHYVSCSYYLLGRLQLEMGLVERSWVSMDPILLQHPRSPTVHYMRAFYWCLSTFTVDCFGDVVARNALETLFAMFTCALGWIFIGQVIGRINALMITLDKDRKQRDERIENLQQYAKQHRLPEALRLRALEGLYYKSECSVALRVRDTMRDLPSALRTGLFYELYGSLLHSVPELNGALAPVHIEALSSALYLEIYLHGDVIYEAGRRGNRLYFLQQGRAEVYSALSGTNYGWLEADSTTAANGSADGAVGVMFGEFAFFLRGARRLASARAVRSCQVLQLERSAWTRLWPPATRKRIERLLLPHVRRKYHATARAFFNIDKNLFVRSDAPMPSLTAEGLDAGSVLARECKEAGCFGPQRLGRPLLPSERALIRPTRLPIPSTKAVRRRSSVTSVSSTESVFDAGHTGVAVSTSGGGTSLAESTARSQPQAPSQPLSAGSQSRRPSAMSVRRTHSLDTPVEAFAPPSRAQSEAASKPSSNVRMGSMHRLFPSVRSGSGRRLSNPDEVESSSQQPVNPAPKTSRAAPTNVAVAASRRSLALSSMLIELQWKRHEKRLRALQLFALSWAAVAKNADESRLSRRRSISVAHGLANAVRPRVRVGGVRSADDERLCSASTFPVSADLLEDARRGPRRHSLVVVRSDLDRKFALAEVAVPLLAARITAHLRLEVRAGSVVRRRTTLASIGANRLTSKPASSVNMDEETFFTDEPEFDDVESGLDAPQQESVSAFKWLSDLLLRPQRVVIPLISSSAEAPAASNKVAPVPSAESAVVALATTSSGFSAYSSVSIAPPPPTPLPQDAAGPSVRTRGPFDVNSRFRRWWALTMLLVTLYHVSVTPYRASFMDGFLNDLEIERFVIFWFALEAVLVDLVFAVDFVLQLRYFAFVDGGESITDPEAISAHYRRDGTFLLDLLSLVPFELLLLGAAPFLGPPPPPSSPNQWPLFHSPSGGLVNWHTVAFFKLNRFVRVAHVYSLSDQLQRALLYESSSLSQLQLRPGMLYLGRLALDFLLGTHWLTCIFFGVSYLNFEDGDLSWLTTPGMLTTAGCADLGEIRRVPVSAAYLRSFHFSIGAITTVCYGDILPMNAVENAATLAVILVSVVLFSILSGGFFKFLAMELGTRAEFEERVAQVGHFMAFHDFPADMWTQMKVYFALSWQESKGMHEEQQLRGLPTALRQDVARHVHANLITYVPLFRSCEEPFSKAVIAAIKHEFFVRNDVIIQRGDMERSLYIVETGLVVISAVRKKKPKARTSTRLSTLEARGRAAQEPSAPDNNNAKAARSATDSSDDNEDDSVNEWLALSRQQSATNGSLARFGAAGGSKAGSEPAIRPRRHEASIIGVVSTPGNGAASPDINASTEREERIVKGPFDYFGERSLLFGTPRNATCVAACVSSLFVLTSDRFDAILEEFPSYRSKVVQAWVMTRRSASFGATAKSSSVRK